jgi:hypothetical protein
VAVGCEELADEAFRDLLKKYHRPVTLKEEAVNREFAAADFIDGRKSSTV